MNVVLIDIIVRPCKEAKQNQEQEGAAQGQQSEESRARPAKVERVSVDLSASQMSFSVCVDNSTPFFTLTTSTSLELGWKAQGSKQSRARPTGKLVERRPRLTLAARPPLLPKELP